MRGDRIQIFKENILVIKSYTRVGKKCYGTNKPGYTNKIIHKSFVGTH